MTDSRQFGRFFLPGPTEVLPEVLAAQTLPMIGHRGKPMEALLADVQPRLQRVFRTARPVYIASCSATGLMEGAIRNGARRRVLSLINGAFSDRFYRIALACGVDAVPLEVPMGATHTADILSEALAGGDFDAVTVVHSETSTGALNPIRELAAACHASGDIALLVDSVTGIGGAPVESDEWELDFVLTGSQKALALPPGLAFGVASESMLARAAENKTRGVYFDLVEFDAGIRRNQTPNTPALSLIHALAAQLVRIDSETIEGRWKRHREMAERTWQWVDEMRDAGIPLSVLAAEGERSPTVTCIKLPEGTTGPAVASALAKEGWTIAPGYGSLKDSTIRIGHMGDHTLEALELLLELTGEILRR